MFCWSRHVGGGLAENRHAAFFWKLLGERTRDVLLERLLERTWDVWKECRYNIVDSALDGAPVLVYLAGLGLRWHWSSLMIPWHWFSLLPSSIFACHNFVERHAPKNFWWFWLRLAPLVYSGWLAEPCGYLWIKQLLLTHVWYFTSGLAIACTLLFFPPFL